MNNDTEERLVDARRDPASNATLQKEVIETKTATLFEHLGDKTGFFLREIPILMIQVIRDDGRTYARVDNTAPIQNMQYSVRTVAPNLGFLWFGTNDELGRTFTVTYQGGGSIMHLENMTGLSSENSLPVGCTYTQYPGLKPPSELYPFAEWKLYTELYPQYAGVFMRLNGGFAPNFDTAGMAQPQAQTSGTHSHTMPRQMNTIGFNAISTTYPYGPDPSAAASFGNTPSTENRPVNMTVQLWVRVR